MHVRIGINPLTWTNDDLPELGADTPLEVCLAEARSAGYAGVELGNKFPRRAVELGPILERHGLRLVSGWFSARLLERSVAEEKKAVEEHLRLLSSLGCKVMVYAEVTGAVHGDKRTSLGKRPKLDEEGFARLGGALTQMGDYLATQGLRMAYHHHMGTVVQSEEDIDALMASTGESVGLLLDTGHLTYAGGNPEQVARRYLRRIAHVHCKDIRRSVLETCQKQDKSFLDAVLAGVFTVPGDGCVPYAPILKALAEASYNGWLVVEAEQDPAKAHPLTYATLGFRNLNRLASDAGLGSKS